MGPLPLIALRKHFRGIALAHSLTKRAATITWDFETGFYTALSKIERLWKRAASESRERKREREERERERQRADNV